MEKIDRINLFLEDVVKSAKKISEYIDSGEVVQIVSHLDADGITAASIIGRALQREGALFKIRIVRWIDENVINELSEENSRLVIFTDLGSGYLNLMRRIDSRSSIIILDHHQLVGDLQPNITLVNPHLYGIDGSTDISGAGVAYQVSKAMNKENVNLAYLAIIGALGDMQDKYLKKKLGGINEGIVTDAINAQYLQVKTDLLFFGRETRSIHKALARSTNPFIPDISGEEDKSYAFVVNLGIPLKHKGEWRTLSSLSDEEKKRLFSALAEYLVQKGFSNEFILNLIGRTYVLIREKSSTPLRDAREFSSLLNATGRINRPSLGLSICFGDRKKAIEEANLVLEEYRRTIAQYLTEIRKDNKRLQEFNNIVVLRGDGLIDEKIISAIASILSYTLPKSQKPLIAYSTIPVEGVAKISARVQRLKGSESVNLGEILRVAAERFLGRGGGHDIAAGAQVSIENIEPFLKLVDELVNIQMSVTDEKTLTQSNNIEKY
jgi:RecJ-like exonuclease